MQILKVFCCLIRGQHRVGDELEGDIIHRREKELAVRSSSGAYNTKHNLSPKTCIKTCPVKLQSSSDG